MAQELARQQPERVRRLALVGTACGWGSKPGTMASLALITMPVRYHSRTVYERTNRLLSPADAGLVDRLPHLTEARLRYPPPLLGYGYQMMAGMLLVEPDLAAHGAHPHARPGRSARPPDPAGERRAAGTAPARGAAAHPRGGGPPVRPRPGQPEPPAPRGVLRRGRARRLAGVVAAAASSTTTQRSRMRSAPRSGRSRMAR